MDRLLKFIINEILYNGHLQTTGSLALVFFSSLIFNISITWDSLAILYLSFYSIYLYNRYREINIDYLTNEKRTAHLKKFNKQIPIIINILIIALIFLVVYYGNPKFNIFISVITFFGFLYSDYFKKLTRKIIIFKNIYVAFVFSLLIIYPFIYYGLSVNNLFYIAPLMILVFLRGVQMQFILDLKDIESDKKEELRTLGVLLGREKVLKLLRIMTFVTAGLTPIILIIFFNFSLSLLFLTALIVFDFYIISLIKKDSFWAYTLSSGEFIIWPVLIIIGNNIL